MFLKPEEEIIEQLQSVDLASSQVQIKLDSHFFDNGHRWVIEDFCQA
jgi:hypothetical protein